MHASRVDMFDNRIYKYFVRAVYTYYNTRGASINEVLPCLIQSFDGNPVKSC